MKTLRLTALFLFLFVVCAAAKEQPAQVVVWPEQGTPVVRFTFGKFKEVGSLGNERTFTTETTAENLWSKTIPSATFALYLYDRNKVRIGEATLQISNVAPGETVKFQTTVSSSGPPLRWHWLRDRCQRNWGRPLLPEWFRLL
jgi:hypothetical protein